MHRASEEERLEIYRNVHDVWGGGRSLEEHVERRLASVSHRRAEWFAGVVDGRVVASLGCHPLEFRVRGRAIAGFVICAVHTIPAARGQGLAPRLIAAVEVLQRAGGRALAMLYSDIGHDYYARMGYRPGPAHTGCLKTAPGPPPENASHRGVSREEYEAAYDRMTADRPLLISRRGEYGAHLAAREPDSERYLVECDAQPVGAFVLAPGEEPTTGRLLEFSCDDGLEDAARATSVAVAEAARRSGFESVGGWTPNVAGVGEVFEVRPRVEELTMLKSLSEDVRLDDELLGSTDWFHESDHV